jgi:hypothetical protein
MVTDIEFMPRPLNFQNEFMDFLVENLELDTSLFPTPKKVFVLPIFEIKPEVNASMIKSKLDLGELLDKKTARLYQSDKTDFPLSDEWLNETFPIRYFHSWGRRLGKYSEWSPIYIMNKFGPLYDQRLSWEGGRHRSSHV